MLLSEIQSIGFRRDSFVVDDLYAKLRNDNCKTIFLYGLNVSLYVFAPSNLSTIAQ